VSVVKFEQQEHGKAVFKAYDDQAVIGSMYVNISGNTLRAIHTEVDPAHEGKGVAHQLLESMVAHARENKLHVIPLCPFVLAQFRRHPEQYADLWQPVK
jgi:uncharacterized protein